MKNYKFIKHSFYSVSLLAAIMSTNTLAAKTDFIGINSQVQVGVTDTDAEGVDAKIIDAEIGVKMNITDFIKANFKLELSDDVDEWNKLLEEAYFIIDVDKSGAPVIHAIFDQVSVGQINQSNGQDKRAVPLYKQHLMYAIEVDERVTGATFVLDSKLVSKLVDRLEVAVYQTGDNTTLSTEGNTVWSAKARRNFKDLLMNGSNLQAQASIRHELQDGSDNRTQASVAMEYILDRWSTYAQAILLENSLQNPDAELALNGGIIYKLSGNISIGGDVAYLDNKSSSSGYRTDYTAFMKLRPMSGVEFGASLTRRTRENGDSENVPGVSTTLSHNSEPTGALIKSK